MCCFGHELNPDRVELEPCKGDVVIVPAGIAHRLLHNASGNFEMVGCYPPGKTWDMCYGKESEEAKIRQIKLVEWFHRDPTYGTRGPTLDL